ncbi:hypothetical protein QUF56_06230 [Ureibacillus composti]|nr:hypothetical protein [Ureibacillus composti]
MGLKQIVLSFLTFLALFLCIQSPQVFAKESSSVVWQGKLVNKSIVMQGATTSKNETLLATYTTKNNVNQYEIFKVNNQTSKIKNLSKVVGGEIHFFYFKGKGYIIHLEKRSMKIYDENFKLAFTKKWTDSVRFMEFIINKSKVDDNLISIGPDVINYTNKGNKLYVSLKLDQKGKLVEVPKDKLPGEFYQIYLGLKIGQTTNEPSKYTNFDLKVDKSTIPEISDGYRDDFSSEAIENYKNHFYLFIRKNDLGMGNHRLLKVNSKGKVVDYLELPEVSSYPEPRFMKNQVIFSSIIPEGAFYHIVNFDKFEVQTITTTHSNYNYKVLNDNLYYLKLDGAYQFYNAQNQSLYTLPGDNKDVSAFDEKGKYGLNRDYKNNTYTIFNLKTGATIVNGKGDLNNLASIDDKVLIVEAKKGYKEVKLIKLSTSK